MEEDTPELPDVEELLQAPEDLIEVFVSFIETHLSEELAEILLQPDDTAHYGLGIPYAALMNHFLDLLEANVTLAHLVQMHPRKLLPLLDLAIDGYQKKLLDSIEANEADKRKGFFKFKPYCHARVCHLMPNCPDTTKSKLPRASDIGTFIEVRGTVIRTGSIKVLEWEREMECSRCKHSFLVHADPEQGNAFPKITRCPSGKDPPCNGKTFKLLSEDETICRDYQEIKIQEQIQHLKVGSIPRSMVVILENDLVDICKPGDDITVDGIVMRRWRFLQDGERSDLEMFILANHIRVNNQQRLGVTITDELRGEFDAFWASHKEEPINARNIILQSICPQLYGLHLVKLAVALVLIGGVQKVEANGLKVRGESHLLLVGDPGTGKSQFLKYAAKLSPRSVLTTGIGTTSAGLTVAAVKDHGGEWMLEAGALVLADGGVCCIDEFSSIRKNDKATIHEAMEQQTLSVAKAGLVCKLRTETTIIAATNPKIKYDKEQSLAVNTALASPLLSRFDLILVLLDEQNSDWDRVVSHFILNEQSTMNEENEDSTWPLQKLQAYISHVGKAFYPVLSPEAERVLMRYYKMQRNQDARNAARTTVRLLESLIRLAQAHSRLMYRAQVTIQDSVIAIYLVEASMLNSALLGVSSALHSSFPDNPEESYKTLERFVLRKLGLPELLGDDSQNTPTHDEAGAPTSGEGLSQRSALSRQRERSSSDTGQSLSAGTHSVGASAFQHGEPLYIPPAPQPEGTDDNSGLLDSLHVPDSGGIVKTNSDAYPIGKPVKRKREQRQPATMPHGPVGGKQMEKRARIDPVNGGSDADPIFQPDGASDAAGDAEQGADYADDADVYQPVEEDNNNNDDPTDENAAAENGEQEDAEEDLFDGGRAVFWTSDDNNAAPDEEQEEEVLLLGKKSRKRFLD